MTPMDHMSVAKLSGSYPITSGAEITMLTIITKGNGQGCVSREHI